MELDVTSASQDTRDLCCELCHAASVDKAVELDGEAVSDDSLRDLGSEGQEAGGSCNHQLTRRKLLGEARSYHQRRPKQVHVQHHIGVDRFTFATEVDHDDSGRRHGVHE